MCNSNAFTIEFAAYILSYLNCLVPSHTYGTYSQPVGNMEVFLIMLIDLRHAQHGISLQAQTLTCDIM